MNNQFIFLEESGYNGMDRTNTLSFHNVSTGITYKFEITIPEVVTDIDYILSAYVISGKDYKNYVDDSAESLLRQISFLAINSIVVIDLDVVQSKVKQMISIFHRIKDERSILVDSKVDNILENIENN